MPYFTLVVAIAIAAVAAWYSIIGLMQSEASENSHYLQN